MSLLIIAIAGGATLLGVVAAYVTLRAKKRRGLPEQFRERWLEIQRLCSSKETWGLAVVNADKLLNEALKKKRLKGKSMGERMVSAQRRFKDNDGVWYAHNLAKKILADSNATLRETEAKKSLVGIRQALRDLEMLGDK